MAIFRKQHSRAAPIVESTFAAPGIDFTGGAGRYTIQLSAPGGPPYKYFELALSEEEMLTVVSGWLDKMKQIKVQRK